MSYDPMDVFGGAIGSLLRQMFLFAAAVWVGCAIGAVALVAGSVAGGAVPEMAMLKFIVSSPVLLLSLWGLVNVLLVPLGLGFFIRSESAGYGAWMVVAGAESLLVVLGWEGDVAVNWMSRAAVWFAWLMTLAMAAAGVLFLRQYQMVRLARHLAAIEAENRERREARMRGERGEAVSEG